MFPVALAWTLGTVIGGLLHEKWLIVAVLLGIAFLAAAVISKGHIYCLLGALCCSAAAWSIKTAQIPSDDISNFASGKPVVVIGTVITDPDREEKRTSFRLRAESITKWGRTIRASGTAEVSISTQKPGSHPPITNLQYGSRIRLRGRLQTPPEARNPGDFSYRAYLANQGVHALIRVANPADVQVLSSSSSGPKAAVLRIKNQWESVLRRHLPPAEAGMAEGLLFSRRSSLPQEVQDAFVTTGTVHLLSASGAHVAALACFLSLVLSPFGRRARKPAALVLMACLVGYGIMCGGRAAVARAVFMSCVFFGADLFDRQRDLFNTLCLSALVLLIANPRNVFDTSFQLSFAAVLGIALIGPVLSNSVNPWLEKAQNRLHPCMHRTASKIVDSLVISLSAQAGIAPVVAIYFGNISLISLIANLFAVPMAGIAVVSSMLLAVIGCVWSPLSAAFSPLVSAILQALSKGVVLFAAVPGAIVYFGTPPPEIVTAWYSLLMAVSKPWLAKRSNPAKKPN
jgi:competence protein ComEC